MIEIKIKGPMYVVNHSNVTYTAMVDPILPDMKIVWFKDDVEIKQFPGEDQFTLKLFDAEDPSKGVYKAMAVMESTAESATSNEIPLDVGKDYKKADAYVYLSDYYPILKGGTVTMSPDISQIYPANAELSFIWRYNSNIISNEKTLTVIDDPDNPYRQYSLEVRIEAPGSFDNTSYTMMTLVKNESRIDPSDFDPRYIHDLRPGRDRGYIWIGWWVHDEIIEAQIDRFDWMADPTNDRFKYKEELETLVYGFSKWPDLEMQESRNGYILRKEDVQVA